MHLTFGCCDCIKFYIAFLKFHCSYTSGCCRLYTRNATLTWIIAQSKYWYHFFSFGYSFDFFKGLIRRKLQWRRFQSTLPLEETVMLHHVQNWRCFVIFMFVPLSQYFFYFHNDWCFAFCLFSWKEILVKMCRILYSICSDLINETLQL